MKATDLRIGNLISDDTASDQGYWPVIKIGSREVYYGAFHLPFERLRPIPLTPEWLDRFGFGMKTIIRYERELPFNGYYIQTLAFVMGSAYIMEDNDHNRQSKIGECKCVHQLQNIYYILTGTELELKP